MGNKLKIGIDLDDVLNSLVDYWLVKYNKKYKDNLKIQDIKSWNIASYTKPECDEKIFDLLKPKHTFRKLDIQPNAYEVTKWLSERFELHIITAYHPEMCLDKTIWVQNNLPHIDVKNIIFCNNKGLVKTDFLIDDRIKNLDDFKGESICYAKPWNEEILLRNDLDLKWYPRLNSWLEIKEYFERVLLG
jgi:5'(3')-deoxyribonucleotidase